MANLKFRGIRESYSAELAGNPAPGKYRKARSASPSGNRWLDCLQCCLSSSRERISGCYASFALYFCFHYPYISGRDIHLG